jgi:Dna[CI] antecedent, DciA
MVAMQKAGAAPARAVRELVAAAVPGLAERMLIGQVRREWPVVAGLELARRSFPLELERGTLHVGADSSAALHELTLRAPDILAELRRRVDSPIAAVRARVQRPPAPELPPPAPTPLSRDITLSVGEAEAIERLASAIADPDLAATVRRVLVKDHLARRARAGRPHDPESPPSPARTA